MHRSQKDRVPDYTFEVHQKLVLTELESIRHWGSDGYGSDFALCGGLASACSANRVDVLGTNIGAARSDITELVDRELPDFIVDISEVSWR